MKYNSWLVEAQATAVRPLLPTMAKAPLKIVSEISDWVKQMPEEIQKWREKLANNKGEIIN